MLVADAIPAPEPAPAPIFGLGLLGRLLAAYSSGVKEEDIGNCVCNRRTFHTKEKEKDKVCCISYLASPGAEMCCFRIVSATVMVLLSVITLQPILMRVPLMTMAPR